jgi:hypothetical protein
MVFALAMAVFAGLGYLLRTLTGRSTRSARASQANEAKLGMQITLDRQTLTQECSDCGASFVVVRGSAYDSGRPLALFLIALHGHSPEGRVAHVAVAVMDGSRDEPHPIAMAVVVTDMRDQFGCRLVSWAESPWRGEAYLGEMLEPDAARSDPRRDIVFSVIDHVLGDLSEVQNYFS